MRLQRVIRLCYCIFAVTLTDSAFTQENPAAMPVQNRAFAARHAEKVKAAASDQYDLVLIGDSITHNLEVSGFEGVWNQFYAPRRALNIGCSSLRTENILWNLLNGEMDRQTPKVITLMVGTNNADYKSYLTHHTSEQIAGGIEAIIKLLRQKSPDSKIILLRCFPYGERVGGDSRDRVLNRTSELAMKLADEKHVFYCDVNHVFLKPDGRIDPAMMPDLLHPSPAGARRWAQAMEPLLSHLMGDKSRDTDISSNTAIIPTPKLEQDSYDWYARHADALRIKEKVNPEIVLIGDSITHFWGGEPKANHVWGPKAWQSVFGKYRTLNLGFGWDRTQNVLWRLDHGELDGLRPRVVVVHIGTNNLTATANARQNTPSEVVGGIREICIRVRSKVPEATIILMGVFPHEENPECARRRQIVEINNMLTAVLGQTPGIHLLDIGRKLTGSDGKIPQQYMFDFCHPTEAGYQIWADALVPLLSQYCQ